MPDSTAGATASEMEFVRPEATPRRIGQSYLEEQVYLRPHPHELMLLNRV